MSAVTGSEFVPSPPWVPDEPWSCKKCCLSIKNARITRIVLDILKCIPSFLICLLTPVWISAPFIITVIILDVTKNNWFHRGNKASYTIYGMGGAEIVESIITLAYFIQQVSNPVLLLLSGLQFTLGAFYMYRANQLYKNPVA